MCYYLEVVYECGHTECDRRIRCDSPHTCRMERKPGLYRMVMETTCDKEGCSLANAQKEGEDKKGEEEGDKDEKMEKEAEYDEQYDGSVEVTMQGNIQDSTDMFAAGPSTPFTDANDWIDDDDSTDEDTSVAESLETARLLTEKPSLKHSANRLQYLAEIRNAPRKKPQKKTVIPKRRWSEPSKKKTPAPISDDSDSSQDDLSDGELSDEALEYASGQFHETQLSRPKHPEVIPKSILKSSSTKGKQLQMVYQNSNDEGNKETGSMAPKETGVDGDENISPPAENEAQTENTGNKTLNRGAGLESRKEINANALLADLLDTDDKGQIFQEDYDIEHALYQSTTPEATTSAQVKALENRMNDLRLASLKSVLKQTNYVYQRPGPVLRSHSAAQKENLLKQEQLRTDNTTKRKADCAGLANPTEELPVKRVRFADGSKEASTHKVLTKPPAQSMVIRRSRRNMSAFGQKPDEQEHESSCPDAPTTKE
ncbi:hypothetical protein AA313_de0202450 [Arthrobotrys entomopaga]|nr:hypothetical protein AA313_de0202450 [Arthrobotrys entomopaga]